MNVSTGIEESGNLTVNLHNPGVTTHWVDGGSLWGNHVPVHAGASIWQAASAWPAWWKLVAAIIEASSFWILLYLKQGHTKS